ncbi:hypothetical protein J5X84_39335 [Streptosporangiaceae bacterium NEAU-GS5]|nr:hypothetical protein [Streptosporangiaceae bacterium NEAU-GS5]
MYDALHRLYQTKLTLLATLCTVAGIALLVLAHWSDGVTGWEWLDLLPATDIGSALFTTGLIVVAFTYIDKEDAETRAVARLRTVLGDAAPAIRDAVIEGFAFNADDLAQVASPETLDQIIRNSLAIQLGDKQLARDVYADLRQQVLQAPERWHDVQVTITLAPWTDGPPSTHNPMFIATARWEYRVRPTSSVLRFACVGDQAEYRELLADPTTTSVFHFEPVAGLDAASSAAFELTQCTVDGQEQSIRRTQRAGAQIYTVHLGEQSSAGHPEVQLSYTSRALIQQRGHLLYVDIGRPSKGLKIDFQYGGCGIHHVSVLDFIAGARQPHVLHTPRSIPTPAVQVSYNGWVFPKSGVAFVWALEEKPA